MPFYPTPEPRRRLRHQRLLRRRPAPRHARRLRRARAHRDGPRHAGDRRPRRQPHLRRASVVPGGALVARRRRGATGTSGATSRPTEPGGPRVPGQGDLQLAATTGRPGEYYLHRFYRFQPDLNIANPAVRDEICKHRRRSGSRSASPASAWTPCRSCSRPTGSPSTWTATRKRWLRSLRSFVGRRSGDAMLLGEVNTATEGPRELLRRRRRRRAAHAVRVPPQPEPVAVRSRAARPSRSRSSSRALPVVPPDNAWATFLRNHDELTLDKLTVRQRDEVFAAFGPEAGHAALRPRPAPPRRADARRRRRPRCGWRGA